MMRSSIFVTGLTLLCSALGFFVQLLMARRYGAGVEVDAYLYAISAPTFFAGMIAALLSFTVVPRLAESHESADSQNKLIVSLFGWSLVVSMLLLLLSPLFLALQKHLLPPLSPISHQANINNLLLIGWCIAGAQVFLATCCVILTGLKSAISAVFLNLGAYVGMLAAMLFFDQVAIENLALGMLLGTLAAILLALYLLRHRVFPYWRNAAWSEISNLVLSSPYTIIAMSCFSAYAVVDSYWAPRAGEGVLSSLGYSQRIIIALGNFAVAGPSAIFVPKFSELIVARKRVEFVDVLIKAVGGAFVVSAVLASILFFSAEYLMALIFTGGVMDEKTSIGVADVLKYCLPGMVFMLASTIALRGLYCFKGIEKLAAGLGGLWVILYFCLSGLMASRGGPGLALAYSLAWSLYFSTVLICIYMNVKNMDVLDAGTTTIYD